MKTFFIIPFLLLGFVCLGQTSSSDLQIIKIDPITQNLNDIRKDKNDLRINTFSNSSSSLIDTNPNSIENEELLFEERKELSQSEEIPN